MCHLMRTCSTEKALLLLKSFLLVWIPVDVWQLVHDLELMMLAHLSCRHPCHGAPLLLVEVGLDLFLLLLGIL